MSQCSQILQHLKRGPITQLQAFELYGCWRLAARVHDLRGKGHDIQTRIVDAGEKHYAQYWLKKKKK